MAKSSKKTNKSARANAVKAAKQTRSIDPKAKIKIVAKDNPFRDGSNRAKAFLKLKSGMTVEAIYAKGREMIRIFNRSRKAGAVRVA